MINRLEPGDYQKVRSQFRPLDYQLIIRAVIEGTSPGVIYVDDVEVPRSALLCSAEGCFLAGDETSSVFNRALRDLLVEQFFAAKTSRQADEAISSAFNLAQVFTVHPDGWISRFPVIFEGRRPLKVPRKHYTCSEVRIDWRARIPRGYSIQRIDRGFLSREGMDVPSHIPSWMKANWGSIDAFMDRGFGFGMIHDRAVVSWSLADCVSGTEGEIGIRTREDYRRKGLATLTAASTVDHAFSRGLTKVGWHTDEENTASIRVAEKVGFTETRDYVSHVVSVR
ncbi:MAG: GNAT family N-acetyltransferase [Thermoplasmata archaeon]